jgi:hypothetical protein
MNTVVFIAIVLFIAMVINMTIAVKEVIGYFGYNQVPSPLAGSTTGWIDPDGGWINVPGSVSTTRAVFSTPSAAQTFCDGSKDCIGVVDNSKGAGDSTTIGYIALKKLPSITSEWANTVAYVKMNGSMISFPAIYKYFY